MSAKGVTEIVKQDASYSLAIVFIIAPGRLDHACLLVASYLACE